MTFPSTSTSTPSTPVVIIAMGVCGSGKTTLGRAIAETYNFAFIEGDELHPKANIDKMSRGEPLNDEDREPWLALLRAEAVKKAAAANESEGCGCVVSCSSLKAYYRDILRGKRENSSEPPIPTYFVYIKGLTSTLEERMGKREGHYMKGNMLQSQLQTLESPEGEEGVVVVTLEDETAKQLDDAKKGLEQLVIG
ncbi:P-loop containing nucleoside triphosphate hydrolase protein [Flagelloscypha sp. PMI_526]|nr:P-loop containing nucleoside triphosphate hydrolase protein [Flagelloscypha sp. PMI_526]